MEKCVQRNYQSMNQLRLKFHGKQISKYINLKPHIGNQAG